MSERARDGQGEYGSDARTAINEYVSEVHEDHLRDHPYLNEYDSAGEYFEDQLGIDAVTDEYYDLPVYAAARLYSYSHSKYLLLRGSPDLPEDGVGSDVHWSYRNLDRELSESVERNVSRSAQTVAGRFGTSDIARLCLKFIIDAVQTKLECAFDGNIMCRSEFERYLQLPDYREFCERQQGAGVALTEGLYDEFGFTTRYKFQSNRVRDSRSDADDDWLSDELNAIVPKVVFALGDEACRGLRAIGFEYDSDLCQCSDGNTGQVLRYAGRQPNLAGTYAVHLYHPDYWGCLTTDCDVYDALDDIARRLDSA